MSTQQPTSPSSATTSTVQLAEQPESSSSSSQSPTEPTALSPTCTNCASTPDTPLKPCLKCHSVSYCSRECLKADTKKHKKVCAAAAQVYAQTAEFRPQVIRAAPNEGHRRGLQKWQFDT